MLKINEYFYHLQGRDLFVHKNHSHNEIEFIQVISGNGLVLKNDKTFLLKSQHIYVIDARKTHIVNPQPEDCNDYIRNKIVIDADTFTEFYESIGMGSIIDKLLNGVPVSTATAPKIDNIYRTISILCNSNKDENIAFAHGYITELIHWIYSNSQAVSPDESRDTFQKILDIINEKEGQTSLDEISRILYKDKHYLCRLFKQKTGITITDYISDKIFEKCRRLLESTSYSIEEISSMCGFSSHASLSRFFKSKYGKPPARYRKERQSSVNLRI